MPGSSYLIVDGSLDDLHLIDQMLGEKGARSEYVHSIEEAVEKLESQSYELVFMDINLPDAQGLEHVKLLHDAYPYLPIVILSGLDDDDITRECLHMGVQDYLPKALLSPMLLHRVATHAVERKMIEQRFIETDRKMKRLLREAEFHNRQLSELSKTDELTSLPNRAYFQEHLHQKLLTAERLGKSLGVLYFDMNGFKMINDTFGHAAGDLVLMQVASRLRRDLRKSDFIARVGGDEFLALTDLLDDSVQSYSVAKKIASILHDPIKIKNHEIYVSASVGIATYPEISSADALIDCADQAMYEAKRNRSHFACFYSKRLQTEFAERRKLELAFKEALDSNQLSAQFQQIVGTSKGISGLEVFCRWNHPELGAITPSTFIPIAETLNGSDQVSAQMLAMVAAACKTLFSDSTHFFAINLSARQIRSSDFSDQILDLANELDIPTTRLYFEFCEEDVGLSGVPTLQKLKFQGFKLALSNFGAGPTSMKLLPELPIDYLKLDRALIMKVSGDKAQRTICENIIRLAHTLGIQVVAEGVESEIEKQALLALGCDHYQGYFMGEPFSLPL